MTTAIINIFGESFVNEIKNKIPNNIESINSNYRNIYNFIISENANFLLLEHNSTNFCQTSDNSKKCCKNCSWIIDILVGLLKIPLTYFVLSFIGEIINLIDKSHKENPKNINFIQIVFIELLYSLKSNNRRMVYLLSKYKKHTIDEFKEKIDNFLLQLTSWIDNESKNVDNSENKVYSIFQLKRDISDLSREIMPSFESGFYNTCLIFTISHKKSIEDFLDYQKLQYGEDFCEFLFDEIENDRRRNLKILDENKYRKVRQWIAKQGYSVSNNLNTSRPEDFNEIFFTNDINYKQFFSFLHLEDIKGGTFINTKDFDSIFQYGFGYSESKPLNIHISTNKTRTLNIIYKFLFEFYNAHGKSKEKEKFVKFLKFNFSNFKDVDVSSALRGHRLQYPFDVNKYKVK